MEATTENVVAVDDDLVELEFSPLAPEEADAMDDRVYLLGVHADRGRVL